MDRWNQSGLRSGVFTMLLTLFVRVPLATQPVHQDPARSWAVDSVLFRFESEVRGHVMRSYGSEIVFRILELPDSYLARKDSLLDGLQHLALTNEDEDVRRRAAGWIAFAGESGRRSPPVAGVFLRLVRIYRASDASVRLTVRNRLPLQADRKAAAAFLRSLAAEPDTTTRFGPEGYFAFGDPRAEALARLAEMGEEGRAVLQAMHRSGEARSPQARIILDDMARRGFPVRDIARMQQERDRALIRQ